MDSTEHPSAHPTDVECEQLVAGGLAPEERERAARHVASCAACAARVHALRGEQRAIASAFGALDHEAPTVTADDVMRRAHASGRVRRVSTRVAAGVGTLLLAGLAAAMPGSPVRSWVARGGATRDHVVAPVARAHAVEPAAAVVQAGSRVSLPAGTSFELTFEDAQDSGEVRLVVRTQPELSVQARTGGVDYAIVPGGLLVRNRGAHTSYDVAIPRTLRRFRLRVGDTVLPGAAPVAPESVAVVHLAPRAR
jgi:hypothetical protein